MQILIGAVFLVLVLALLCRALQNVLRRVLAAQPALIFLSPLALSAVFCGIASGLGALSLPLAAAMLAYTLVPTAVAFATRRAQPHGWADFGAILLLWLPLELGVGRQWAPGPVQGMLHTAAYGVSVTLGLTLFLLFRRLDGMKYTLPRNWRDFVNPLLGFAAAAPVLILVGRAVGFLPPFHAPSKAALGIALEFLMILAGTALPEEILFRALIQNSLMQRFGAGIATLLLASVIFGAAHLDNGPLPIPNWQYATVATLAGVAYGWVFQKSSSIFASALLHALVNTVKHSCF